MREKIFILSMLSVTAFFGVELSFLSKSDQEPIIQSDLELIKNSFQASSFVETGTYSGCTASSAATIFPSVYTIEIHEPLYQYAKQKLSSFPNVFCYLGDSVQLLPQMIQESYPRRVYWLDAHYCGEGTGGLIGKSCLLQEIDQIIRHADLEDICLINDLNGQTHMDRRLTEPLRQIVEKIQDKDPDYCFYSLGDIGLIYNQRIYPEIQISGFAKAATISRLFDPTNDNLDTVTAVIESEEFLSKLDPNTKDGKAFFSMRRYLHENPKHDGGELLYRLWLALADIEQGYYGRAMRDLRSIVNSPFLHWRIIAYYIKALCLNGYVDRAKHFYHNPRYQKDSNLYPLLVTRILGEEIEAMLNRNSG